MLFSKVGFQNSVGVGPFSPSAPPLEEGDFCDLYTHENIPVAPSSAYSKVYSEAMTIYELPFVNFNDRSVQTLKKLEEQSKQGMIPRNLAVIVRVLYVVEKIILGLSVGVSSAGATSFFIFSASLGAPVAVILSSVIIFPVLGSLLMLGLISKVSAYVLENLKKRCVEHSFRLAIRREKDLSDPIEKDRMSGLKGWFQLQSLPGIKLNLQNAMKEIDDMQLTDYNNQKKDERDFLSFLIQKIDHFQTIEKQLDIHVL